MAELAIITPSRGRPRNITAMLDAIEATACGPWRLWLGLDDDDRQLRRYLRRVDGHPHVTTVVGPRQGLTGWTNRLAEQAISAGAQWLASLGDDHHPRTVGWDLRLTEAVRGMPGPGFAYPNDLLQRQRLCTAWVQSTRIVQALGWMALPTADHLCIDSAVMELGTAADRLAYLDDVVVEHMHPAIGKAREDDTYRAGNSAERVREDGVAFQAWLSDGLARDAAVVRGLVWCDH